MNKHIWKIDFILILISVGVLIGVVGYAQPLVIGPIDNFETSDGEILFEFVRADVFMIDDNSDFTSPVEYLVEDGIDVELMPGTYYWKVSGIGSSEVRKLTVNSKIELEVRGVGEVLEVRNAGNVGLNLEVYEGNELIGQKRVGASEEADFENRDDVKIIGGQE